MRNQRGMTLVMAMALALVLGILGYALVQVAQYETRFMVKGTKSDAAFYLANAGIEYAIYKIRNAENYSGSETVILGDGVFVSSTTALGNDEYEITSTGYIPDETNPKEKRTIKAKVTRTGGMPGADDDSVIRGAQEVQVSDNTSMRGTLRCNAKITVEGGTLKIYKGPHSGQGDVLSHTDILIKSTGHLHFDPTDDDAELRARGNIYPNGEIKDCDEYSPGDTTSDTDKLDLSISFDTTTLLDKCCTHGSTWDSEFNLSSGTTHVQYFPNGITFNSNTVFVGTGTLVAKAGEKIKFNCSVGSYKDSNPFNSTFCRMNIIILGGTGAQEVDFAGSGTKFAIWGYICCGKLIKYDRPFSHKGALEAWGMEGLSLKISDVVWLQWEDFPPDNRPPGFAGNIAINKWEEITT